MIAFFFDSFVDLIRHFRGWCISSRRITKNKGVIELHLLDQVARLFVIVIALAGESDYDVRRNGNSRPRLPDSLDKIHIFFRGVSAVHRFQDFVRPRLHRQMNVFDQFR